MAVRTVAGRSRAAAPSAAAREPRRLPSLRTALIAAAAYVIAVVFLLPYLEMLITAVRPQRELFDPDYLPHHFAWSNLTNMWGAAFGITSGVRVSLEIAGGATLLVLLVALPAAYYTSRHRFRGRAGFNLAFAVWILNAYISSIPAELEQAAMVDGSSRLGALFRITLPLAMPGVVTALIFTFIAAWNEFISALTLTTSNADYPLTVRLDSF